MLFSCEDILVPFVTDKRMPADCLYWILEEDFRFWPPGKDPDGADTGHDDYRTLLMNRVSQPDGNEDPGSSLPPTDAAAKRSSLPPSYKAGTWWSPPPSGQAASSSAAASSSQAPKTLFHCQLARGNTDESLPNCGFAEDVADMVRIATMCSRYDMGDLIWMSWVPQRAKPTRIGHGSQAILMTAAGFESVRRAHEEKKLERGHIDLKLQKWLLMPGEAARAHACYLYPPIGSYTEHASECDPKQFGGAKTRPSGFDSGENPCHGCRCSGDPKGRWKWIYAWRGPDWTKRETWEFPKDEDLHNGKTYWWKTFIGAHPDRRAQGTWQPKHDDAALTERQKRSRRAWKKANSKRCFVDYYDQAHCVCMLQHSRMTNHTSSMPS